MAIGLCVQPSAAQAKKPTAPRKTWSKPVEGRADTQEIAERVALLRAQDELEQYLHAQMPALRHLPSEDYIHANLVKKVKEEELTDPADKEKGRFLVTLEVSFTDSDYQELLRRDYQLNDAERQERIQERMLWLAKLLIGLVALLAAVTGYFRLEEATKGYYTLWLRVLAISFLAAVGAGLWWMS
jgi:hypothetical protein